MGLIDSQECPESYESLGTTLIEQDKLDEAVTCFQQAIALQPNYIEAYKKLGHVFLKQGNLDAAIDAYQQALNLDPNYVDANYIDVYNNMGIILYRQGHLEGAIACYQQVLNCNPNYTEAYINLGNVFARQNQLQSALDCYQRALVLNPNSADIYVNLGHIFDEQNQPEKALDCYQRAIALDPNSVDIYVNMGVVFEDQGQYEQAMACYTRALELCPDSALAHLNRALLLLRAGDFDHGFVEYEWRLQCPQQLEHYQSHNDLSKPVWDGSHLDGQTILIHSEQGLGDTIQFIRYASFVAQRGGRVVVECQEPLVRAIATVAGITQLVVKGNTLPEFDVHVPLMSLPRIFKTTQENIPASVPYLKTPESSIQLKASLETKLKVGFVWAANSQHPSSRRRSCPLIHFVRLFNTPSTTFYSLQKGPQVAELTQLSSKRLIQDLSNQLNDFADTAAVVEQLDLVITVDTSVAHLAGAMNKPVWVLLCYNSDWRWMLGREDSPWYPTMRLFRQQSPGDWVSLLKDVEKALHSLLETKLNAANSFANLLKDSSGMAKKHKVSQSKGFTPKNSKN
jgi:tetratricopeptide (TPR) repeat protein